MISRDALPDGAAVGSNPSEAAAPRRRPVSAGFGSPGEDFTVRRIDLNEALIRHPQASFVMRATGRGMRAAGIDEGDVLLVDRAIKAASGHVVIAVVDGELLCRRLCRPAGAQARVLLQAADPATPDIAIGEALPLEIWGVVTTVIKSLMP
jgi:DNA polymerase V